MLREELGAAADTLVPLVKGGVTMVKLRGAMHDTCNTANLVALKVRGIRNDAGKDMYGAEEWAAMQSTGSGWQDFLCGNHSRNLHFDAYNRAFTTFMKELLGEGMAVAKMRSGGSMRVEPDGEAFVRSICKLADARWLEAVRKRYTLTLILYMCPLVLTVSTVYLNQVMGSNFGIFVRSIGQIS